MWTAPDKPVSTYHQYNKYYGKWIMSNVTKSYFSLINVHKSENNMRIQLKLALFEVWHGNDTKLIQGGKALESQ